MKLIIKEVAKRKGMKHKEICKKAGISKVAFSRIINGHLRPSIDTLQSIADALGVDVVQLIHPSENYGHFYIDGVWEGIRRT